MNRRIETALHVCARHKQIQLPKAMFQGRKRTSCVLKAITILKGRRKIFFFVCVCV